MKFKDLDTPNDMIAITREWVVAEHPDEVGMFDFAGFFEKLGFFREYREEIKAWDEKRQAEGNVK